jgi:hypothetical protein
LTVNTDGSISLVNPNTTGTFTFDYQLENSQGTDTATATIVVQEPPTATDDGNYNVNVGETLTIATSATNDLLDNDTFGFPTATLTQFGGGSLGGAVTDNNAGTTATLAGGTLTVNADGSISLANPSTTGTFTFDYQLENSQGTDTATATIVVQQPPTATDDAYTAETNQTLTIATADANDIIDNDIVGSPAATITGFGGGSLGGAVTDNTAGSSVNLAGGTLTVNADGSLTLANPNTTGTYSFNYRLENSVATDDGTITIEVTAAPTATDDSGYLVAPGGTLSVVTTDANDLLDNDMLGNPVSTLTTFGGGNLGGDVTTNAAGDAVGLAGGTLTVNGDGSFSLTNPTVPGSYNFDYQLSNSAGTADGTVNILVGIPPVAVADGIDDPATTTFNEELNVLSFDPTGQVYNVSPFTPFGSLLGNDTLGFPAASITSFGGGDLGGFVTDNAAGSSVALAGGTLTVGSDGSITLVNATTPFVTYTFSYRLENAAGVFDAMVDIFVFS